MASGAWHHTAGGRDLWDLARGEVGICMVTGLVGRVWW